MADGRARDHPRVCGEHERTELRETLESGSSPRMRGALGIRLLLRFLAGIIPAYAGSTHAGRRRGVRAGDHPRVCGEHHPAKEAASLGGGSSPRMRGAPVDLLERGVAPGIIPAYAGSTSPPRAARGSGRDHPRVCGEHLKKPHWHVMLTGSSPRMRGAPPAALTRLLNRRIIPAYAGSTSSRGGRTSRARDHPRVCGEHRATSTSYASWLGSSPRMRGARRQDEHGRAERGIIPAYAGSTAARWRRSTTRWDHPRVCGEHRGPESRRTRPGGSSPRMRGAPLRSVKVLALGGIIPAYAGSTFQDNLFHK